MEIIINHYKAVTEGFWTLRSCIRWILDILGIFQIERMPPQDWPNNKCFHQDFWTIDHEFGLINMNHH